MTRFFGFAAALAFLAAGSVHASTDEDYDVPYLLDDDITALEASIAEDATDFAWIMEGADDGHDAEERLVYVLDHNEMPRLGASGRLYHLLILDRRFAAANANIATAEEMEVLYIFRHGARGYLIAVYASPADGPVFPLMPHGSRIMVNLTTTRRATLTEFVNSAAFRRFVTNRAITQDLRNALR